MKKQPLLLMWLAAAGSLLVATHLASAGSQVFTFTYGPALGVRGAYGVGHNMGPGAARTLRGTFVPSGAAASVVHPEAALSENDLEAVLLTNAPGCDEPNVTTSGFDFEVEWPSSCFDFGESVSLCFSSQKTPIEVSHAALYDDEGKNIFEPTVTSGPEMPSCPLAELDCSGARAVTQYLWPPNHQLAPVAIVGIEGSGGDPVTITVTGITQDEPLNASGDGNTCPDAVIVDGVASVRMERAGNRNGRVYTISFIAESGTRSCEGTVQACVPHDQSTATPCADDGQSYISTVCPEGRKSRVDPSDSPVIGAAEERGSATTIQYSIPLAGQTNLGVFDVTGRRVATLVNGVQEAGAHQVSWNSSSLSSGLYFYRLRVGDQSVARVLLITR